ncbi:hypothetical protein, partial [Roseateles sp. P5_E8]
MFEPLDRKRVNALLREFQVSDSGLKYVDAALAAPSTNVQGTSRNVVSIMPSAKTGMVTQTDSKDTKFPFALAALFDPKCLGVTTQPPPFEIRYVGRGGRKVRTRYSPSALGFYTHRGVVIEHWEPATSRGRLDELYPGRYRFRADGTFGCEAVEEIIRPMGFSFVLRFADELSEVGNRNRRLLYSYTQPAAEKEYLKKLPELMHLFEKRCQISVEEILLSGTERDVLYFALATNRLDFDFDAVPLATQASVAQVFKDSNVRAAWEAAVRPDGSRPSFGVSTECRELQVGDELLLDGKRIVIRYVGATSLMLRDDRGDRIALDFLDLEAAKKEGKLVLPGNLGLATPKSRFYFAKPAQLE